MALSVYFTPAAVPCNDSDSAARSLDSVCERGAGCKEIRVERLGLFEGGPVRLEICLQVPAVATRVAEVSPLVTP